MPTSARPNDKDQGFKNNLVELNGSAILLSNMKDQHQPRPQQPQDLSAQPPQKQQGKHDRDVSKSNLLGRH